MKKNPKPAGVQSDKYWVGGIKPFGGHKLGQFLAGKQTKFLGAQKVNFLG